MNDAFHRRWPIVAAFALAAATLAAESKLVVAELSRQQPGGVLPDGWDRWLPHPPGKLTRWKLVRMGGSTKLRAISSDAGSGLVRRVHADLAATPRLTWSWRVLEHPGGAQLGEAGRDDAAARLCALFGASGAEPAQPAAAPAPASQPALAALSLPSPEAAPPGGPGSDGDGSDADARSRFGAALPGLAGEPAVEHALCYAWTAGGKPGTVLGAPGSDRVRSLIARSGKGRREVPEQRDLVSDFRDAFGSPPGPLVAVGLLSDSDDTHGFASAYFGDIALRPR